MENCFIFPTSILSLLGCKLRPHRKRDIRHVADRRTQKVRFKIVFGRILPRLARSLRPLPHDDRPKYHYQLVCGRKVPDSEAARPRWSQFGRAVAARAAAALMSPSPSHRVRDRIRHAGTAHTRAVALASTRRITTIIITKKRRLHNRCMWRRCKCGAVAVLVPRPAPP